jgi:GDP-4-dehydro-6-deoxy-D-mannose reductase
MRVLVTGASGFVGAHLLPELRSAGHEPVVVGIDSANLPAGVPGAVADLRDAASTLAAVDALAPEGCIHLAAQAHVPTSWNKPAETMDVNVTGTLNLLEAFRRLRPAARILFISTAEVYGRREGAELVSEDAPLNPESIYGISKAAADMAARAYARHHGMAVVVARPQNHIGPGQAPIFAAASFAAQIAALLRDPALPRRLLVGNLHSERDFADVRDVVHAYRLLLERGTPGRAYNIGSGRNRRVSELLDALCHAAGLQPERVTHPPYFRPTETPAVLDTRRILTELAWKPAIPFEQTVRDILAAAR